MAEDFLTVDVTVSRRSIPTPPVDFRFDRVDLPSLSPIETPDISLPSRSFDLPDIDFDGTTIRVPDVDVRTDSVDLGETGGFFVPEVELPRLDIETIGTTIFGQTIEVVDPFDSRLVGGDVGFRFNDGLQLPSILVPDVDVDTDTVRIRGFDVDLPTITTPSLFVDIPDIPGLRLPTLSIPAGAELDGSVAVADPTGIDVDVDLDTTGLRSFALEPVPDGILSDPKEFAFTAARAYFEAQLGLGITDTLRSTVEATLQVVLTEDTRERLRERGEG